MLAELENWFTREGKERKEMQFYLALINTNTTQLLAKIMQQESRASLSNLSSKTFYF